MKIDKLIPGKRVQINEKVVIDKIINNLNPNRLDSFNNMKKWKQVNNEIFKLEVLKQQNQYCVLYLHPVHSYMNKVFEVDGNDLLEFMKNYIDFERGNGVDIIISTKEYVVLVVCTHDGVIYLV